MLKFLEGRDEAVRSPIKYIPEMAYGNSFESPPEFQTSSTIFYRRSYINPFLKNYPQGERPPYSLNGLTSRTSVQQKQISSYEQHPILGESRPANLSLSEHSRYLDSFHRQLASNPNRFRLTRGQFTDYVEKNNHYKSIGPLQGIERSIDRIEERKKSVWIKPVSKRDEMTSSLRYASSLNTTVKSSISQNSQLLTEKIRIRRNRERIQRSFRKELEVRHRESPAQFDLPKQGANHQLYLITNQLPGRETIATPPLQELDRFDSKLTRKLQ